MENGDYASHYVYTKLNRSSHGRCSHDTETGIRSSANTAWSRRYLYQRRGLAPLVQMAHQLVGYLDAPVSLTALAGSTWPLRPHMDTGAESTQYSSRLVHIAGGGGAGRGDQPGLPGTSLHVQLSHLSLHPLRANISALEAGTS